MPLNKGHLQTLYALSVRGYSDARGVGNATECDFLLFIQHQLVGDV